MVLKWSFNQYYVPPVHILPVYLRQNLVVSTDSSLGYIYLSRSKPIFQYNKNLVRLSSDVFLI